MRLIEEKQARQATLRSQWKALWQSKPQRDFSETEVKQLAEWNAELDDLGGVIDQMRQLESMSKSAGSLAGSGEQRVVTDDAGSSAPAGSLAGVLVAKGFPTTTSIRVPLDAVIAKASTWPSADTWSPLQAGAIVSLGRDQRWLYTHLPSQPVADDTSVDTFVQTGSRTVTGSIERDIDSTAPKATIDVQLAMVPEELRQLAILMAGIPNALFSSVPAFSGWVNRELRFQIDSALDAHVYSQIIAAGPPSGAAGADLVSQVRAGVGVMRDLGYDPDLLVVSSDDAATLDLTLQPGTAGGYLFASRTTGSASPLWGLRVVERAGMGTDPPLIVDSQAVGILYTGSMRVDVDPFSGFATNTTSVRMELNALMSVNVSAAAFQVTATP